MSVSRVRADVLPHLSATERGHVSQLRKRLWFLWEKMENWQPGPASGAWHYIEAEAKALQWAIELIEDEIA